MIVQLTCSLYPVCSYSPWEPTARDGNLSSPAQCCQTTQSTKEGTENYTAHFTEAVPNTQSKVLLANLYGTIHRQNQALQLSTLITNKLSLTCECNLPHEIFEGKKKFKSHSRVKEILMNRVFYYTFLLLLLKVLLIFLFSFFFSSFNLQS